MTQPKGPAERAAERIANHLRLCNPHLKPIEEIITAEYASIEQENKELQRLMDQRNRHELTPKLPDCQCPVCNVHRKLNKAEQENQRLREDLELARAQQAATAATRNRYLSELNKLGAL